VQNQLAIKVLAITLALVPFCAGCIALPFITGRDDNPIVFAEGELRSAETASLEDLAVACRAAIDILGYDQADIFREEEQIRWQTQTAGGDPVEIHLTMAGRNPILLRIRIGIIGDEARSRLVLEEIHRALAGNAAVEG
jgi:hypothetical protein